MVEEFKVAKCRLVLRLRDSTVANVRDAGVVTRSGKKWSASSSVSVAESSLQLKDVNGNLGYQSSRNEIRHMVKREEILSLEK